MRHDKAVHVGLHEVGPNGEARPSAILTWLQVAAEEQASESSIGTKALFLHRRAWSISRYRLELDRSIWHGDKLIVSTWPSSRSSALAIREFEICDEAGARVLAATTAWVMIDLATRRPVDITDLAPENLVRPIRAISSGLPSLPPLDEVEYELVLPVMLRDLDLNVFVNATVHVSWAIEALPLEVMRHNRLHTLEVDFRAEASLGDTVVSRRGSPTDEDGDQVFVHSIASATTGGELSRLRTRWTPREL